MQILNTHMGRLALPGRVAPPRRYAILRRDGFPPNPLHQTIDATRPSHPTPFILLFICVETICARRRARTPPPHPPLRRPRPPPPTTQNAELRPLVTRPLAGSSGGSGSVACDQESPRPANPLKHRRTPVPQLRSRWRLSS